MFEEAAEDPVLGDGPDELLPGDPPVLVLVHPLEGVRGHVTLQPAYRQQVPHQPPHLPPADM